MSYILDALKKSEIERKRSAEQVSSRGVQTPHSPSYATGRRLPYFVAAFVALILASAIIVNFGGENKNQPALNEVKVERSLTKEVSTPANLRHENTIPAKTSNGMNTYDDLPFLWEKPESFRNGISLAVSIHVYAEEPSQRILFINDKEYKVGEQTQQGPRIESIEPQGVILSYRGEYFKLPRPR